MNIWFDLICFCLFFSVLLQAFLFAIILVAAASPSPQLFPNGYSPLLARYAPAPQAPASTVHADHVAAVSPAITYASVYPYAYVSTSKKFTKQLSHTRELKPFNFSRCVMLCPKRMDINTPIFRPSSSDFACRLELPIADF